MKRSHTDFGAWIAFAQRHKYALLGAGFLLFFLLLLLPIPRSGSIIGSVDNLFMPALGDTVVNRIISALTGQFVGRSMYPSNILRFGETASGVGAIFVALRFLGFNDIYAVYLTQVAMLTLMGFAAVLLAEQYTRSFPAAILSGFAFTTFNFVWADIDHLAIHFYFLPLLSAYFLKRAIALKNGKHLFLAGLFGGLQMYFSVQVYVYQTIIIGMLILFSFGALWKEYSLRDKALFAGGYVLVALPLFLFYLHTVVSLGVADPFPRTEWEPYYALGLADFLKTLPGKLIHYPFSGPTVGGWFRVAHSAFVGLAAPALALVALRRINREKLELVAIGAVGLFFSLGTSIEIGTRTIVSPLALFYQYVPLSKYLRVELRSYTLTLLALSILAGIGWARIAPVLARAGKTIPIVAVILVTVFIGAENISWPTNPFETIKFPSVPAGYVEFFRDKPNALILDLPSQSTSWPAYIDDIIYVIWQTKHERNILGGVTGYYPLSRVDVQHYTDLLPSPQAFRYFRSMGVTYFVWHDSPSLVCHIPHSMKGCDPTTGQRLGMAAEGYSWLETSPDLQLVFENSVLKIYALRSK